MPSSALLRALVALLLLHCCGAVLALEPTTPEARAAYIRSHYTKYEYRIPMRDGTRLFTAVYVPNATREGRRYPILLTRTPYGAMPYGVNRYRERIGPTAAFEKEGFIFAIQDVRGAHMSEGSFVNMRPHIPNKQGNEFDESSDCYDTIEWLLAKLAQDNGKVGLWGISYPGFYASAGAIDSHPALKAVSPQAPIADWFRGDDMHRHGAFNLQLSFAFFSGFGQARPKPTASEEWKRYDFGTPDAYQWFLELGPVANAKEKFDGPVAFFDEIIAHPDYDDFWQSRNLLPHLRKINAAVLTVGGWYDTEDLYGPLQTYASIERHNAGIHNTLIMGPWPHGGWSRDAISALGDEDFGTDTSAQYQPLELAFFVQHLKSGADAKLPEAWMFETGANRWREFAQWPPAETKRTRLQLAPGGQLDIGASVPGPQASSAFDSYPSDPAKPVPYTQEISQRWSKNYMAEDQRFVASRPDVLVYRSAVLEQDLTIAGPLEAELYFSTSGSDADLVIKLIDEWPGTLPGWNEEKAEAGERNRGGQQTLVRGEPFRLRYRNSYSAPEALIPDTVTPVRFAVNDVFHTFKRGHRIMVQIQSSWFPFIDRNPQRFVPNIYTAKAEDFVRAEHRIWRSADYPSALIVPVLPPADE